MITEVRWSGFVNRIAIDTSLIYVMSGKPSWVLRRSFGDGSLDCGFGTGGVATSDRVGMPDYRALAIDSSYLYFVGMATTPGSIYSEWRIEKRCK